MWLWYGMVYMQSKLYCTSLHATPLHSNPTQSPLLQCVRYGAVLCCVLSYPSEPERLIWYEDKTRERENMIRAKDKIGKVVV